MPRSESASPQRKSTISESYYPYEEVQRSYFSQTEVLIKT